MSKIYKHKLHLSEDFIDSYDNMSDDSDDNFGQSVDSIIHQQGIAFDLNEIVEECLDIVNTSVKKINSLLLKRVSIPKGFWTTDIIKDEDKNLCVVYNALSLYRDRFSDYHKYYTSFITASDSINKASREFSYVIGEYDAASLVLAAVYLAKLQVHHETKGILTWYSILKSKSNFDEMISDLSESFVASDMTSEFINKVFTNIIATFDNAYICSSIAGTNYCPKATSFLSEAINQFLDLWKDRSEKILNDPNSHLITGANSCMILSFNKFKYDNDNVYITNQQYIDVNVFNGIERNIIPDYIYGSVQYHYAVVIAKLIPIIYKIKDIIKNVNNSQKSINEDYIQSYDSEDDDVDSIDNIIKNHYAIEIITDIINHVKPVQECTQHAEFGYPEVSSIVYLKVFPKIFVDALNHSMFLLRNNVDRGKVLHEYIAYLFNKIDEETGNFSFRGNTIYQLAQLTQHRFTPRELKNKEFKNISHAVEDVVKEIILSQLTKGKMQNAFKFNLSTFAQFIEDKQLVDRNSDSAFIVAMLYNILVCTYYYFTSFCFDCVMVVADSTTEYDNRYDDRYPYRVICRHAGQQVLFEEQIKFIRYIIETLWDEIKSYK